MSAADPAFAPRDLCLYGEPCCTPAGKGASRRWLLRGLGVAATGLAVAGAALPLLPTTPFALLAAWAFARSSPALEARLNAHPSLGPALAAWRARRAIPVKAKAAAAVSLPASWGLLWTAEPAPAALAAATLVLIAAGAWILSRPS